MINNTFKINLEEDSKTDQVRKTENTSDDTLTSQIPILPIKVNVLNAPLKHKDCCTGLKNN